MRKAWTMTEDWVRMELDVIMLNQHMILPPDELTAFGKAMIKKFRNIINLGMGRTPFNNPDIKMFMWVWLKLHPDQQQYISTLEDIEAITEFMTYACVHPALLADMQVHGSHTSYWKTEIYVQAVHGATPKSIVKLDRDVLGRIYREYYCDPTYAARNRLAIQFNGNNRKDIEIYIGDAALISMAGPERLVFQNGQKNWQIPKDHFVWFTKDGTLHTGDMKAVILARSEEVPKLGFWVKPGEYKPYQGHPSCPEIEV